MRSLAARALVLGAAAAGVLAYAAAAAAAAIAQAGDDGLRVHIGPLVFVAVERVGRSTATTFGPALLAVAMLGGLANAAAAVALARRSR
jgi:hypothetical protein